LIHSFFLSDLSKQTTSISGIGEPTSIVTSTMTCLLSLFYLFISLFKITYTAKPGRRKQDTRWAIR
jgi:hypothetical protein